MLKPAVGDTQDGLLLSAMDNTIAESPHVTSNFSNNNCVELCIVSGITSEELVHPFIHPVKLRGEAGDAVEKEGLFDDGAMVDSICKNTFTSVKDALGELVASERLLCMVDGTIVPSCGQWSDCQGVI